MPAATAILKPHVKDIGGLEVRRLLPAFPKKMVGPFICVDHMGPARFAPGEGIDVRPHPHIGLATVTYLFEGAIVHRDSLGFVQRIAPGDVNWMTAGSGIVHSERSSPVDRAAGSLLHGIQTWIALPLKDERTEPAFVHHPKATLPVVAGSGTELRVIAGHAFGERSPVRTHSDVLYVAAEMQPGGRFGLPPEHEERGVYVVEGEIHIDGGLLAPQHMAVVPEGRTVTIEAATFARVMLLGGANTDGDRHIWWNFVASSREMIEEAKVRWREGSFGSVPGETEFIPLPGE
jgi:redox-sensitive bicupin YhaK (pirin superfamily)